MINFVDKNKTYQHNKKHFSAKNNAHVPISKNSIYKYWLNADCLSLEEKDEIQKFTPKEIDLFFNDNPFSFGTAGIRRKIGVSPQHWNIYTYRLIAAGYATYIKEASLNNKVIVTHDNRPGGDAFAMQVAQVLCAHGLEVFLAPHNSAIPTPILSYLIKKKQLAGAINITASHNPIDYNGFKCYNSTGCQTNNEEEEIILKHVPSYNEIFTFNKFCHPTKFNFLHLDYQEEYFMDLNKSLSKVLKNADVNDKNVKFLFSSHHGASSQIMRKYAHDSGFQNFQEYAPECSLDEVWRPEEILNPEDPNSFVNSQNHADRHDFLYQIAHDPDSDRAAILEKQINGQWYFFNGNQIAILFVDFLLQYLPDNKPTTPEEPNQLLRLTEFNERENELELQNAQESQNEQQINNKSETETLNKSEPETQHEPSQNNNKKYIVSTYVSGNYINRLCKDRVDIHITKTGFKNIAAKVEEEERKSGQELLLAFEEAVGCLIFPIGREKDGFQQVILLLNMICKYKEQGINLLQRYYRICEKHGFFIGITKYFMSTDPNWKTTFNEKIQKILNHPVEEFFGHQIQKIQFNQDADAVEMILEDDNWIKFRLSGTEPKFKIYYNLYADNHNTIQERIRTMHKYFKKYLGF